jgi:hypothetical protein
MDDAPDTPTYSLPKSYLCELQEESEKHHTNVASLLKSAINEENDKHLINILCELYFLDSKLEEELRKYDLTNCEEEEEFIITEIGLFIFRTILLSRNSLEKELSCKNYSVKNH